MPHERRRRLLFLGLAALLLVAAANVVVLFGGRQESVDGDVDVALVLGAGVTPEGTPSYVLQDRLDEALALRNAGRVRRILVSGDHGTPSYDEPGAMRTYLEARGVPPDDITLDHAGFDTYSSVWRAKHVFGASRVVVVTQAYHLPRALWVARALGMQAEGRAADRRPYRGRLWFEAREIGSRTKALLDVMTSRTPRYAT
jgi:SanA protein